jgi:FAD/FMN-containing dehydrogenase
VVTEFEFALHLVAGETLLVDMWFSLDDAPAVLQKWRQLAVTASRQATFTAWVGEVDGKPQVSAGFVWVGNPDDGLALLHEFRGLGRPVAERVAEPSYLDLQRMDDTLEGHAQRRYWKGHYFKELPDEAIEAFVLRGTADGHGDALPNASFQVYGGAIADVPDEATAFSHRDTFVEFVAAARWSDPAEDDQRIQAARQYATSLAPFASGAYVNVLTDEGQSGVKRAYPPEKLARLTALKDAWDPDNVFHLNHNIPPSK